MDYSLRDRVYLQCDNSSPSDKVEVRVEVDVREEVEERGQSFLKEQIKHIKIHKHLKQ